MDFEMIIPIAIQDIDNVINNISFISSRIKPTKIVIIASCECIDRIKDNLKIECQYLDENKVIPGLDFKTLFNYLKSKKAEKRTGWYFQQFLKMYYSHLCKSDYYLSWDIDTIPLIDFEFNREDKLIFDVKDAYHKPYFDTLFSLLGLEKQLQKSFICEHMMFSKEYMKELICKIDYQNKPWYINIIDNINPNDIAFSGFSEFETYGNYVMKNHNNAYITREISALRNGGKIFGNIPSKDVLYWLSKQYDTIAFEKWDIKDNNNSWYKNKIFRFLIKPKIYVKTYKVFKKIKSLINKQTT